MLRAAAVFICLSVSVVALGQDSTGVLSFDQPQDSELRAPEGIPGIKHFRFVDERRIFLAGGRPTSEGAVYSLAQQGTKMVISLQGGDVDNPIFGSLVPYWEKGETPAEIAPEKIWVERNGMKFVHVPLNSTQIVDAKNLASIESALRIVHEYVSAGGQLGSVFIHCAHGVDRTGLIVALYRVLYMGWSPDNAYAEWRLGGRSLANLTITWPMDLFFRDYIYKHDQLVDWILHDEHGNPTFCEYNLIL